jgi:hypothetical protein
MNSEIEDVITAAVDLAMKYRRLTGKPLGITGEVAECRAAQILGLTLVDARTPGYDAIGPEPQQRKIQIKGRCLADIPKPGQRLGSIKFDHEWDSVLLVLMTPSFQVTEMWEANRFEIAAALSVPGSKARNERGALSVQKFKQIGTKVWPNVSKVPSI